VGGVGGQVSSLTGAYQQYLIVEIILCYLCIPHSKPTDSLDENMNHKIIHSIQTVLFDRDSYQRPNIGQYLKKKMTEMRK
jgi:hypothetical protein